MLHEVESQNYLKPPENFNLSYLRAAREGGPGMKLGSGSVQISVQHSVLRVWQDQACFWQQWVLYYQEKLEGFNKYALFLLRNPRQKHSWFTICSGVYSRIQEHKVMWKSPHHPSNHNDIHMCRIFRSPIETQKICWASARGHPESRDSYRTYTFENKSCH